jgi:hypothetical protein
MDPCDSASSPALVEPEVISTENALLLTEVIAPTSVSALDFIAN